MTDRNYESQEPIERLLSVMATLRRECAWTKEQTHESLRRYVIEEAFEAADAIDAGDSDAIKDELGDVLMQVVFHAAIAESSGEGWDFHDVAATIAEKLIHRSPHVFGDEDAASAEEVDALWQKRKAERAATRTPPKKVPALPALMLAQKYLERGGEVPAAESLAQRAIALVAEANEAGIDLELAVRDEVHALSRDSQS